jgi:RNA polymerase sigma-70 factor (ECF subfamily)
MADDVFDNPDFLARLRGGDSRAYNQLVRRYHGTLVGVATSVIGSRAQAEEVVQDTWIAVLNGVGAFEGRSSLSTWLFSIVLNRARTRVAREGRLVGLPAVLDGSQGQERAVPTSEFTADGHWITAPSLWDELDPERVVAGRQLWEHVLEVIERLPAGQKTVLVMRDMEGQSAEDACEMLGISPENQRVLLHRARGRVRKAIDELVGAGPARVAGSAAARRPGPERRPGPLTRLGVALARLWRLSVGHGTARRTERPRSFWSRAIAWAR